jgi:hypothetical protein
MKTFSITEAKKLSGRDAHGRAEGEANAQNATIPDGSERRKTGRSVQVLFRVTPDAKHSSTAWRGGSASASFSPFRTA